MKPLWALAATVLLLSSSAPCVAGHAGKAGEPEYFLEGMRCLEGPFAVRLPATLPELLAMAPVLSQQVLQVEQWEGYKATRKKVRFAGLTLGLVTFSNDPGRYSLASAEIRSEAWLRISPFGVGQDIDVIRRRLGRVAEDDLDLRSVYSGENESVHFQTRSGRVTAVIYECYTG